MRGTTIAIEEPSLEALEEEALQDVNMYDEVVHLTPPTHHIMEPPKLVEPDFGE